MKRINVIDKVLITNEGIKIHHKELQRVNGSTYSSSFVNSLKKLDSLRKKLHDFNFSVPTVQAYNSDYFTKTVEERSKIRDDYVAKINSNIDEYDVSQDDMESSIIATAPQLI